MKDLLILLVLPFALRLSKSYDFKKDFERDRNNLKIEHNLHNEKQLKQFEQFKSVNLADFKLVTSTNALKRWVRKTPGDLREINVVEVSIPNNTTKKITEIGTGNISESIHGKGTFTFKTYVFKKLSRPKVFYYLTEHSQGLIETGIDGSKDEVMYESIVIGIDSALDKAKKEAEKIMKGL